MIPNVHRRKGGGPMLGAARPDLPGPYGSPASGGDEADEELDELESEQQPDETDGLPPQ
ncbi:hypothetical protein ACIBF1_32905 [Spirillospora sp. NPDC050679]